MRFKDEYEFEAGPLSARLALICGSEAVIDDCMAGDPFNCHQCTEVVLEGAACVDVCGNGFCTLDCLEDYLFEQFRHIQRKREKFVLIEGGGQKSDPIPFELIPHSLESIFNIDEVDNGQRYDSN